ncbi:hypothetical protein [Prevotella heparinolytica]|uniref:hypothetical protein n=1 Tax=Prevotella heparinolytica TaxID=28113 RepID=UPI0013ECB26E|nr:hypothetical protein [Bacteroides heparinolyticus]
MGSFFYLAACDIQRKCCDMHRKAQDVYRRAQDELLVGMSITSHKDEDKFS